MFTPEERDIFEYHDGGRPRRADPAVIDREFRAAMAGRDVRQTFADAFYDLSQLDEPLRAGYERETILPAAEALLAAARRTFGVTPFDGEAGTGLTEGETLDLLLDFGDWKAAKKAAAATSPNSSDATDGPPVAAETGSTTGPTTGSC